MKRIMVTLLIFLTVMVSRAKSCQQKIFGENYTYISFTVIKDNDYPIFFNAVTKAASIDVYTSNLNGFVECVFSACDFVPEDIYIRLRAFKAIYGDSEQTYNSWMLFNSLLGKDIDQNKRETNLFLRTGEKIHIEYINITGVFFRGDKTFVGSSSVGLPEDLLTMNTAIIPVALSACLYKKDELKFNCIVQ